MVGKHRCRPRFTEPRTWPWFLSLLALCSAVTAEDCADEVCAESSTVARADQSLAIAGSLASQCALWAEAGECVKNPTFMFSECGTACDDQQTKARDTHAECSKWAAKGECEANAAFMLSGLSLIHI